MSSYMRDIPCIQNMISDIDSISVCNVCNEDDM